MLQAKRRRLEEERAHLFPHIPLVEGILEMALNSDVKIKVNAHVLIHIMASCSRCQILA